ncbi:hypothetical protein DL93DRAFT_2102634 [Clavulina sp. PMI_390]|nr:hypothetical protein DL93DRAFT_2102634 [Clavulina sp. PMI_390]
MPSIRSSAILAINQFAHNPATHAKLRAAEMDLILKNFVRAQSRPGGLGGSVLGAGGASGAGGFGGMGHLVIPPLADDDSRNAKKWAREALKAFEMSGHDSLCALVSNRQGGGGVKDMGLVYLWCKTRATCWPLLKENKWFNGFYKCQMKDSEESS